MPGWDRSYPSHPFFIQFSGLPFYLSIGPSSGFRFFESAKKLWYMGPVRTNQCISHTCEMSLTHDGTLVSDRYFLTVIETYMGLSSRSHQNLLPIGLQTRASLKALGSVCFLLYFEPDRSGNQPRGQKCSKSNFARFRTATLHFLPAGPLAEPLCFNSSLARPPCSLCL